MKKRKGLMFLLAMVSCFALASCGKDGKTPYIGENGNWWIGEEDTGVSAKGDKGDKGDKGKDGSSTTIISINKTGSSNNVDTYTITFSDNKTTTFTVTNGKDGNDGKDLTIKKVEKTGTSGLIDTYTITFSNNTTTSFTITNGKDGQIVTIESIQKTKTVDLIDTYTVTYTDGNSFSFTVTNGKDGADGEPGLTPHIGENGNWWIGEEDTGVPASLSYDERELTPESTGFVYTPMTVNGKSGLVLTGIEDSAKTMWKNMYNNGEEVNIVIPNYVSSIPVIGIGGSVFETLKINSISLSKNTVYLGAEALDTEYLTSIDFNNCKLEEIPYGCFASCKRLRNVELPTTVKVLRDEAFESCPLASINLENITYFGNECLQCYEVDYIYLGSNVEYIGDDPFDCAFLYLERSDIPTTWGPDLSLNDLAVITNAKKNDTYIYGLNDGEVTLYRYFGSEKKYTVPATLDGNPIVALGAGFNSRWYSDGEIDRTLDDMDKIEAYYYIRNNDGYIDEIIIGNNVKRIETFALANSNMYIYISDSVEEIYISDEYGTGMSIFENSSFDIDDAYFPIGLVIIEDTSKTKFNFEGLTTTYDELLAMDDDYEVLFKANIDYDDVYYDSENEIYYAKDGLKYELINCSKKVADTITILDSIDLLPVKTIGRFAFYYGYYEKIIIGENVNKIKPYAFGDDTYARVYIPNNVEIINANAFYMDSSSKLYAEVSAKQDDWDTNWNSNGLEVIYSTSKSDFVNKVWYGDFEGVIKNDGTIELVKYNGVYGNNKTIVLPSKINGISVTSVRTGFYNQNSNYSYVKIYIPKTITTIAGNAFQFYISSTNTSYYPNIYLEAENVPSGYSTNWYYNTYSSDTSRINCYTNQTIPEL